MALEVHDDGKIAGVTGEHVELYRLLLLKQALDFEEKTGMRMSGKVPKATTICRRQYGLKGNYTKLRAGLDKIIKEKFPNLPENVHA